MLICNNVINNHFYFNKMNSLRELLYDYGCSIEKFTDIDTMLSLILKFNNILGIDNIKYVSCKDDAGIFVLVTNFYVVKVYK